VKLQMLVKIKPLFTARVVKQWKRIPRDLAEHPSMDVFRTLLEAGKHILHTSSTKSGTSKVDFAWQQRSRLSGPSGPTFYDEASRPDYKHCTRIFSDQLGIEIG